MLVHAGDAGSLTCSSLPKFYTAFRKRARAAIEAVGYADPGLAAMSLHSPECVSAIEVASGAPIKDPGWSPRETRTRALSADWSKVSCDPWVKKSAMEFLNTCSTLGLGIIRL